MNPTALSGFDKTSLGAITAPLRIILMTLLFLNLQYSMEVTYG